MTHKKSGFTLIELLVVVSIIALLASIVIVSVQKAASEARDTRRKADIKEIKTAMEQYANNNHGKYPRTLNVCGINSTAADCPLSTNLTPTAVPPAEQYLKPYLEPVPKDPTAAGGHKDYQYVLAPQQSGDPGFPTDRRNGYGILVTWENGQSCITGVNLNLTDDPQGYAGDWWGKSKADECPYQ